MSEKQLPWEVKHCAECIEPENYDGPHDSDTVDVSINIYKAFIADDCDGFQSGMCRECEEGIVPSHLPEEQVIRFIKNIFDKHDLQI